MKPKTTVATAHLSFPLATAIAAMLATPAARAAGPYYWDNNGSTAGFGTIGGTWSAPTDGPIPGWSTDPTGAALPESVTTGTGDTLNFGTATVGLGTAGIITVSGTVNAGNMTFGSASAAITLSEGMIDFAATTPAITVNNASDTISSILSGTGLITLAGTGTLTLNGTATNTITGGLNVNGGTLALDFSNIAASTSLIADTNTLGFGGGNLTLKGKAGANTTTQTLGDITVNAGGTLLINPNGGTSTTLTLGTLTATAAGGSLTLGKALSAGTGTVTITTTSDKNATTSIYGGRIVFANGTANTGYDWATSTGTGTYTLSAYGSYATNWGTSVAGATNTNNSRIQDSGTAAITHTLAGPVTTNSLKIENTATAAAQTLALAGNTLTLTSGGLLATGTRAYTISGTAGATRLTAGNGSGTYDLVVNQYNSGGLTISAVIGNHSGSATSLTKAGTGDLTLSGSNTYSGATNINAGMLQLGNVNALQNTSGITMATGTTLQPTVINAAVAAPITTAGTVKIGAPTPTTPAGTWNEFILNAAIGGTGNVTLTSAATSNAVNTVTLNAVSTYSGSTLIDTSGGANSQIFIKPGVNDALPTTTVLTIDGQTGSGTGRVAEINMNGFSQTLAGLTNTSRSLRVQRIVNSSKLAAATLTISGPGSTTFSGYLGSNVVNFSLSPSVSNANSGNGNNFGLTKNGTGTFTLSPPTLTMGGTNYSGNSHVGATKILGGILSLGDALAMSQSALDTANSIAGDATNGLKTTVTTLTMGGLTGDKNLADVFTTPSGGYSGVTTLTLNPVTGVPNSYGGVIANGASGMNLTKTGAGTQTLSGANSYTGTTTVSAGTLKLDFSAAGAVSSNIISPSSKLSMAGGTLVLQGNASTTNSQQVSDLKVTGGLSSSIQLIADPTGNPMLLTLGAITRDAKSTVDFTLPAGTQSAMNGITTTTPNASGSILGGWATVGGTSWASNNGTNIVALESFTTTTSAGIVASAYTNNDMDVDSSAGTLDGVITTSSLRFNTAAATTLTLAATGNNVISSGGILVTSAVGNNLSTITGGTLAGAASGELSIYQNNTGNSLVISSVIANNGGATGLTKAGAGTLVLSGANTYTGGTALAAGTLQFAQTNSMPAAGAVAVGAGTTLAVNGGGTGEFTSATSGNGSIGGLLAGLGGQTGGTVTYSGVVTLGIDTTNAAGGSLTYSGAIANTTGSTTLGITKLGTGTLNLTGASTYTGALTINGGTLQIGAGGTIGNVITIAVNNATTLTFARNDTWSTPDAAVISSPITINSGGTVASGGFFTTIWNLTLNGGTLTSNGGSSAAYGTFDLAGTVTATAGVTSSITTGSGTNNVINLGAGTTASNTTFNVGAGGTLNVGTVLQDHHYKSGTEFTVAGGLIKTGTGILTLAAANTYTGNTVVNGGTLELAAGAQLKFVLGATSGASNSLTGSGTAALNGSFVIDTSAADALPSGIWTLENVTTLTAAYGSTFSVVGFTDAGGNKWTKPNGLKTYTFDETTGTLTLSQSAYAGWAGGAAFTADSNGDGVANGLAWILGADSPSANGQAVLPVPGTETGFLTLHFKRVYNIGSAKLYLEYSNDLNTLDPWHVVDLVAGPLGDIEVVETSGSPNDDVTVKIPTTHASASGKLFARLHATEN